MGCWESTGRSICCVAWGREWGEEEVRLWRELRARSRGALYGTLGILILSYWVNERPGRNSEHRSDVISFGILFW